MFARSGVLLETTLGGSRILEEGAEKKKERKKNKHATVFLPTLRHNFCSLLTVMTCVVHY